MILIKALLHLGEKESRCCSCACWLIVKSLTAKWNFILLHPFPVIMGAVKKVYYMDKEYMQDREEDPGPLADCKLQMKKV